MKACTNNLFFRFLTIICSVVLLCSSACSSNSTPAEPEHLQLQIGLKKSFSAGIGDEVSFNFYTSKDVPMKGDMIVFRGNNKKEFNCPVSKVNASSFSFTIQEEIPTGQYLLILRRGEQEQQLGGIFFSFIKRTLVEDKEGFNIYGQVVCDGKGVPGVLVSDGIDVVQTDQDGIYYLDSDKKYGYVWISIPSGYEASSKGVLPLFCSTLKSPINVHERFDFELVKTENDKFTMYILGDMHLANRNQDLKQFEEFTKDLNNTISRTPGKEYVLTLGDMTWDLYWYTQRFSFKEYLDIVNDHFKDIQFFHTMGNHDNDYERIGDFDKEVPYREHLTPTFYSYNIGQVHFIVMDNIDYNNVGAGTDIRDRYVEDITADQMNWLRKDLSHVDKSHPIVFSTHAPIFRPHSTLGWVNGMNGANDVGEANTKDLINAFKGYTVHFFTGHTHRTFVYDRLKEDHFMEHNGGSICGSWWWSGFLTPGINLAQDGAPGGYTILTVDGKDISWQYKATGYPVEHQFHTYDMNEVKKAVTMATGHDKPGFAPFVQHINDHEQNTVLLNIWNYDPQWKIVVKEDGKELAVKPVFDYDPLHILAMTAKRFATSEKPNFLTVLWNHFFEVQASDAESDLEIEVTDRFGNVYKETMERPRTFTTQAYLPQ